MAEKLRLKGNCINDPIIIPDYGKKPSKPGNRRLQFKSI
jgi:hypothetical protein